MIEFIKYKNSTFSIIVRKNFQQSGIQFFTPNDYSQQLAYMSHPRGKEIQPHIHKNTKGSTIHTRNSFHKERKVAGRFLLG